MESSPSGKPYLRILYVDAYDSFSNNIVGLLERALSVHVVQVKIDDQVIASNLELVLSSFSAVVVGPGPGHPRNPRDVGFINHLWGLADSTLLPVLGICLGFQSLALAFGASIDRLEQPRHGLVTEISHCETDIFEGIGCFRATQYHSLQVNLGHDITAAPAELWSRTVFCPALQPLAWDLSDDRNGAVLQAIKHDTKPFWGVQFHPESICTTEGGSAVIQRWWTQSLAWMSSRHPIHTKLFDNTAKSALRPPLSTALAAGPHGLATLDDIDTESRQDATLLSKLGFQPRHLEFLSFPAGRMTILELCEALNLALTEVILLDSQETKGRYSVLGLIVPQETLKLTFTVLSRRLTFSIGTKACAEKCFDDASGVWDFLKKTLQTCTPHDGPDPPTPFCGGLMGYISYEAGLDTIGVTPSPQNSKNNAPDINLAFVERSIVMDYDAGMVFIQSLRTDDYAWLSKVKMILEPLIKADTTDKDYPSPPPEPTMSSSSDYLSVVVTSDRSRESQILRHFQSGDVCRPTENKYSQKVLQCQEALYAGDSYELCLTDQTVVTIPKNEVLDQPWVLYKHLRHRNPAPFGAYLRLGGSTILGSSPERFLSWDRQGRCQMRPIKGTVKKSESMPYSLAKAILNTSKERAENLMIVDLVRHDLSGVVGAHNCRVPKLMQVEEYETVYQLVSVIEGQLPSHTTSSYNNHSRRTSHSGQAQQEAAKPMRRDGISILNAALPPGSMTGAPKKRSCELLQDIEEHRPRGIYSGVLGYMDVYGGGDFSVVIRTAFRWDDEVIWKPVRDGYSQKGSKIKDDTEVIPHQVWRVGAGGAVTVQSTDKGEFEEMETKLESILRIFQPQD
ncbi:para-aminobenzoate synthase, (PABA) [Loxospora ochrophaea]|nr:para-aminobenzoate synthase, (PABA) [Loxospora ochrophaea]